MVEAKEVDREFTPGTIRQNRGIAVAGLRRRPGSWRGYLLSHGLGGVQARHYEAHEYDDEKRDALLTLFRIATGESAKVTPSERNEQRNSAPQWGCVGMF